MIYVHMENYGIVFFLILQSVDVGILHFEFLNIDQHFTVCILRPEVALVPTAFNLF